MSEPGMENPVSLARVLQEWEIPLEVQQDIYLCLADSEQKNPQEDAKQTPTPQEAAKQTPTPHEDAKPTVF